MNYLYSYVEFIDFLAKDKEITIISNYKLEEDERLSNLRELFCIGSDPIVIDNDASIDDIRITITYKDLNNTLITKKIERAFFQDIVNSDYPLII